LNSWEAQFGGYLDADDTGTVLWWHRNPPCKPWSINVLLESGHRFFPDFIVGIDRRPTLDHGLLTDPKERFEVARELPKLLAAHEAYGRVVIVTKNDAGKWALAEMDPLRRVGRVGQPFRIADAARY
jgi:hypothetical protein